MNPRFPRWLVRSFVWLILPAAWWWVKRHELRILRQGSRLTPAEKRDAAAAGVADIKAIRVLVIEPVPTPGGPLLRWMGQVTGFPLEPPAGMALGHGIYLDPAAANCRHTFLHECVHVAQYERLGGDWRFLRRYLEECIRDSYWNAAMEQEANQVADRVCGAGA